MSKKNGNNFLFNFIAPVYGLFYKAQKKRYSNSLLIMREYLNVAKFDSIIDIGCGTGAMCSALNRERIAVTGIDPAKKMLKIGMEKKENINIRFMNLSTKKKLPFADKSFDLSVASYVAHGMKPEERKQLYKEMSRLTKHYVILYDYNDKRAFLTSIIEWLERGDYFNFIKNVESELNENFISFKEIKLDKQASWYICRPLVNK